MTWAAIWKFFADNPIARLIVALFVIVVGWNVVKKNLKEAGRKAEREANAIKQAQTHAARVEHSSQVVTQERTNADQALEARDSGQHYPTFDELPDPHKRILLGHRSGEAGS